MSISEEELLQNAAKYANTRLVGFFSNFRDMDATIPRMGQFHFNRLMPIHEELAKSGIKILLYSPFGIDFNSDVVRGYILEGETFIPVKIQAPKVLGDWCLKLPFLLDELNHTMKDIIVWLDTYKIQCYASRRFGAYVSNKQAVYQDMQKLDYILQPQTERFHAEVEQLSNFIKRYPIVFIKPRNGAGSEEILVLKHAKKIRDDEGDESVGMSAFWPLELTYYPEKFMTKNVHEVNRYSNMDDLMTKIKSYTSEMPYLIQQGIEIQKYKNNQPMDLRILFVNNGIDWNPICVAYVGLEGVDISSLPEGSDEGKPLLPVLNEVYGANRGQIILDKVLAITRKLTEHFSQLYVKEVPEMAYDIVLDKNENPYFLEVNTKPSVISPNHYLKSTLFNILPEERAVYEEYIFPHGRWLGQFLKTRLDEIQGLNK